MAYSIPYGTYPMGPTLDTSDFTQEDKEAYEEMLDQAMKSSASTKTCPPGEGRVFQALTGAWICQAPLKEPQKRKKDRNPPHPLLVMGIIIGTGFAGWTIVKRFS